MTASKFIAPRKDKEAMFMQGVGFERAQWPAIRASKFVSVGIQGRLHFTKKDKIARATFNRLQSILHSKKSWQATVRDLFSKSKGGEEVRKDREKALEAIEGDKVPFLGQ